MIHYTQYRPAYFDGFDVLEGTVETVDELLEVKFIKNFMKGNPKFKQFSLSISGENYAHVVVELNDGAWVVATLHGKVEATEALPLWVHKPKPLPDTNIEQQIKDLPPPTPLDDLINSGVVTVADYSRA